MKKYKLLILLTILAGLTLSILLFFYLYHEKYENQIVKNMQTSNEQTTPLVIEPPLPKEIKEKYVTIEFKTIPPKAQFYINNKYYGLTPISIELDKNEKLEVIFKKKEYYDYTISSFFPAEDKKTISVNLQKIVYYKPAPKVYTPVIPTVRPQSVPKIIKTKPVPKATPTTF